MEDISARRTSTLTAMATSIALRESNQTVLDCPTKVLEEIKESWAEHMGDIIDGGNGWKPRNGDHPLIQLGIAMLDNTGYEWKKINSKSISKAHITLRESLYLEADRVFHNRPSLLKCSSASTMRTYIKRELDIQRYWDRFPITSVHERIKDMVDEDDIQQGGGD
jgi:hypothetical protein